MQKMRIHKSNPQGECKVMQLFRRILVVFLVLGVTACATTPQPPVDLPAAYWSGNNAKIGVLKATPRQAAAVYTGSIGILDYAIISATNSSLTSHLETLDLSEFDDVEKSIHTTLKDKGLNVVTIDEAVDPAKESTYKTEAGAKMVDLSRFKTSHAIDQALLISLDTVGTTRSYYGPIPTSEPSVVVVATGRLIDLSTQKVLWYQQSNRVAAIPQPWDESNLKFPNLTNTIYKELDSAKTQLLQSFMKSAAGAAAEQTNTPVQTSLNMP